MSTLLSALFGLMLAVPMIAAIETGFAVTQSDHTRRMLYAVAAVWYMVFLLLFAGKSPLAGWFYAIPQLAMFFAYGITKFRAAPLHRR